MKGWVPYLFILTFFILTGFSGQYDLFQDSGKERKPGKILRSARKHTLHGRYDEARRDYLELVRRYPDNRTYNYETGVHYFHYTNDDRTASIPYLEKALEQSKKGDTLPELFYMLGEAHHLAGNYDKASSYYDRFQPYIKSDGDGAKLKATVDESLVQITQGTRFMAVSNDTIAIENLGPPVNTQYPDYAPVVSRSEDRIMFTSRRAFPPGQGKDRSDEMYYENIFVATGEYGFFESPVPFAANEFASRKNHDALVSMSADSTMLLTYRDNMLWKSMLTPEGTWSTPQQFDPTMVNARAYTPHGVLGPEGNKFIFSSQRPGGAGGLDLYMSERQSGGTWSEPLPISILNTKYDEDSPFLTLDGKTLYFSSKGHTSMGGYDVFKSELKNGQWSAPVNLGAPINTAADEIYYTEVDTFLAYYASSRPGGLGGMDIYRILYRPRPVFHRPIVLEGQREHVAVSGARLKLLMPEEISVGQRIEVNPDLNIPEGYKVHSYYWRLPGGQIQEGKSASFLASHSEGKDSIILEVLVTNDKGVLERLTVVKPFDIDKARQLADGDYSTSGARLRLLMPDEVAPGQDIAVNPELYLAPGYKVKSFTWQLPGGKVHNEDNAQFRARKTLGKDSVRLEVLIVNEQGMIEKITVTYPFQVKAASELLASKDSLADKGDYLSSGTKLRLLMPEEITVGQQIAVNPELSVPEGYTIQGYKWHLPGGQTREGSSANFVAGKAGSDSIRLEVMITNKEGIAEKLSVAYPLNVKAGEAGTVAFSSPVYFDFDKTGIKVDATSILREYVEQLKNNPALRIRIEAHADVRGPASYNKSLSLRRAKAVEQFLIKNGVRRDQIVQVEGRGEESPLNHCTEGVNCPESDHAVNRRATLEQVR